MNPQERAVIDDLFDKLAQAEVQAGPREPVAERHIRTRIERQPGAPYLMAQTIVMQQQALEAAQTRLSALEDELSRRPAGGGGFLSNLFGGGSDQRDVAGSQRSLQQPGAATGSGFSGRGMAPGQPGRGGGFLAGAAQTAMGVAGGVLLGSMIGNMFGGGAESGGAGAGEAQAEPAAEPEQLAADDSADFGGDFGGDEI